jgi:hypothetical protein
VSFWQRFVINPITFGPYATWNSGGTLNSEIEATKIFNQIFPAFSKKNVYYSFYQPKSILKC